MALPLLVAALRLSESFLKLTLHTRLHPAEIRQRINALAAAADLRLQVVSLTDIEAENDRLLRPHRFSSSLLSGLSLAALSLALLGVVGLLADLTSRKRHEIGVRRALGANRRSIDWLLLRAVVAPTAVGIAIGVGLSWPLPALLSDLLYDADGATWSGLLSMASILLLGAILVGLYTIRRSNQLEPSELLRTH